MYGVVAFFHFLLATVSLLCGFGFPFYFGWYDECSMSRAETVYHGWSITRDLTDLYLTLLFIGFIHAGFAIGILSAKSLKNVKLHQERGY